jgi:hypothetical protein
LVALLAATTWNAQAQSTFGTILGTVQDISGAVIPGALITAHSLDENAELTTTSGSGGEFVFENLKAGRYKVTVRKEGFTDSVVFFAYAGSPPATPPSGYAFRHGRNYDGGGKR